MAQFRGPPDDERDEPEDEIFVDFRNWHHDSEDRQVQFGRITTSACEEGVVLILQRMWRKRDSLTIFLEEEQAYKLLAQLKEILE